MFVLVLFIMNLYFNNFLIFLMISEMIFMIMYMIIFFFMNLSIMIMSIIFITLMILDSCLGMMMIFEFFNSSKMFFYNNMIYLM